jgi:hypothetical protein
MTKNIPLIVIEARRVHPYKPLDTIHKEIMII